MLLRVAKGLGLSSIIDEVSREHIRGWRDKRGPGRIVFQSNKLKNVTYF